jgi:hypothetical protein
VKKLEDEEFIMLVFVTLGFSGSTNVL